MSRSHVVSSSMLAGASLDPHFSRLSARIILFHSDKDANWALDDRFIAKELSRAELQAMETFAPAYFDYMSSAVVAKVSG